MRDRLVFSGLAWPGATSAGRHPFSSRTDAGTIFWGDAIQIETTGNGRRYSVDSVEGWWRDFGEIRPSDEARAVSFVRRRGDPLGLLAPGKPILTSEWMRLATVLRQTAVVWKQGEDGVDRINDENLRSVAAEVLRESLPASWLEGKTNLIVDDDLDLVPVAKTLDAYMALSAFSALRRAVAMRRCVYCSSWFEIHRTGALHCSASCRAASHVGRKSPHGFDPQDYDEEGDDRLAGTMERAGTERKKPRAHKELSLAEGSQGTRRKDAGRGGKTKRRRS